MGLDTPAPFPPFTGQRVLTSSQGTEVALWLKDWNMFLRGDTSQFGEMCCSKELERSRDV